MAHNSKQRILKSRTAHRVEIHPTADKKIEDNPWLNGTFSDIDFKALREEYGTCDDGPVGRERIDYWS